MSPEYVSLPVPVDRVQEVYELLARPSGAGAVDGVSATSVPWSEELLQRAYDESSEAMRAVLETLASRPGETIPVTELTEGAGLERGQLPGVLGAFGRRWKNRYRQGEANLPFKSYRSIAAGMTVYEMDAAVAAVLTRVATTAR